MFHYSLSAPNCAVIELLELGSFGDWKKVQTLRADRGLDVVSWIVDRGLAGFSGDRRSTHQNLINPHTWPSHFSPGLESLLPRLSIVAGTQL